MDNKVRLDEHYVCNTSSYNTTRNYDYPWSTEKFKDNFKIKIIQHDKETMEFDLIGLNTAFANGFRRCLLSQVPCMAIEKVYMYNNTSVMQDEVLAHRLGLIPLKADSRKFKNLRHTKMTNNDEEDDDELAEDEVLQFELKIKYTKKHSFNTDPINKMHNNNVVLSKHIKWIPIGDQDKKFKPEDVGPICDEIVITKLAAGSEIDAKLYAFKGTGKDHAKFQTVGTACYRLLPEITLLEEFEGERAERLQRCFSPGVIDIFKDKHGVSKARIGNTRYDSGSRNCFRYNDFKNSVQIKRVPDHFIFTIESLGIHTPDVLFLECLKILGNKCDFFLKELKRVKKESKQ